MKPSRTSRIARLISPALLSLAVAASRADTVALTPTADAFVAAALPANNYGGAGALSVAAAGLPRGEFQSVLRFDAAAAFSQFNATYGVGNWTVQSVGLRLTATAPNNAIFNASAAGQFNVRWMQDDSWTEGTGTPMSPGATGITFATLPGFLTANDENLGAFPFAGGTSGSATYALGLTPLFTADLQSGGLIGLRLDAADASVSYLFNSRSITGVSNRPELSITAVPEPGSALLVAILLLANVRRTRP